MSQSKILDFNLKIANSLNIYTGGVVNDEACKLYISEHIKQINGTSTYVVFKDNKPVIVDRDLLREAYMIKFSNGIQKWNAKRIDMCTIVCKPNQPMIVGEEINVFAGFLHIKKPYDSYSNDAKCKVNFMLRFIQDVLCSGDEEQFKYIISWTANVAQGKKNDSVLYFKGDEGIGKSTYTDFLRQYVFGFLCTCKGDTDCLLTSYNKMLQGKVLVVFEELPTFSTAQWDGVSSKLKDYVTGTKCNYSDKYEKKIELDNLNNYIINTNVHALKHSDGRRYFILDLSDFRKGDHEYFDTLRSNCFNIEIGEAFFSYLMAIDVTNFYSQKFPETVAKQNAKIRSLPTAYQFIKDCYVLKQTMMTIKNTQLYDEYVDYVNVHRKPTQAKIDFYDMLSKIGIVSKKPCGFQKYKVSVEQLDRIAEQNGWLHHTDDKEKPMSIEEQLLVKEEELVELHNEIKSLKAKQSKNSNSLQCAKDVHDIKNIVNDIKKTINRFPPLFEECSECEHENPPTRKVKQKTLMEKPPTKKVKQKPVQNEEILMDDDSKQELQNIFGNF